MLHLSHHIELPHFAPSRELALSPITDEDDELINDSQGENAQAIVLDGSPDVQGLEEFWSGVQQDLESDPEWFNFAEDD